MDTKKYTPFLLSIGILILDQVTKALIVAKIPLYTVGASFGGDFLRIIHVRNTGVAFSLGSSLPDGVRSILFIAIPLIVLALVAVYAVRGTDITRGQRWVLAAIVGGGFGNQIDRVFRGEGVVDFVDVKFYGLFGLERWPTFNVADATVVVASILLIILLVVQEIKERKS